MPTALNESRLANLVLAAAAASLFTRSSASAAFVSMSTNLEHIVPISYVGKGQPSSKNHSRFNPHFVCKCSFEAAASAADCDRAKSTAVARTSAAAASSALRSMFSRAHCRPCCNAASYESCISHTLPFTALCDAVSCCEEHQCLALKLRSGS